MQFWIQKVWGRVWKMLYSSNKVLDWSADRTFIMNLISQPTWVDPRPGSLSSDPQVFSILAHLGTQTSAHDIAGDCFTVDSCMSV